MKSKLLIAAVPCFSLGIANATLTTVIFDSSFTAGEGYADGTLSGQPGIADTQAGWIVSSSATNGTVTNSNGGFIRAQFGGDVLSNLISPQGEMILVEVAGLNIASNGINDQILRLGLSDGGSGGSAAMAIGGQLTGDTSGNIYVENAAFGISGSRVSTGLMYGDTFDYAIKLTAESAGATSAISYTIEHIINGATLLTETGQPASGISFNPASAPTNFAGFLQDQDGPDGSSFSFDGLTLSTTIPEPSMVGLLGLGFLSVFLRRRR